MIVKKSVNTFVATIYLGLKDIYNNFNYELIHVENVCQKYVDKVGLCVSIRPEIYIYTKGREYGCSVTLINYPRFPANESEILSKTIELAKILMEEFRQMRCTVVTSTETIMLSNEELIDLVG